jgi:hypothetical protein
MSIMLCCGVLSVCVFLWFVEVSESRRSRRDDATDVKSLLLMLPHLLLDKLYYVFVFATHIIIHHIF